MKASRESLAKRREELTEQIARQRTELAFAYRNLAKPLEYTQTGIRGFQALRQNAWLVALAPSFVSLVFTFFGWKKKGGSSQSGRASSREEAKEIAQKARKPLAKWMARGWGAFQLYRRIRPFFP